MVNQVYSLYCPTKGDQAVLIVLCSMFGLLQTKVRPSPGGGEEAGGNVRIIKKVTFEKWDAVKDDNGDGEDASTISAGFGGQQDQARLEFEYKILLNDEVCPLV